MLIQMILQNLGRHFEEIFQRAKWQKKTDKKKKTDVRRYTILRKHTGMPVSGITEKGNQENRRTEMIKTLIEKNFLKLGKHASSE